MLFNKKINYENVYGTRNSAEPVTLTLLADDGSGTKVNVTKGSLTDNRYPNGSTAYTTSDVSQSKTAGEYATWSDLPVWRLVSKGDGSYEAVRIQYYVQEAAENGYITSYQVTSCDNVTGNPVVTDTSAEITGEATKTAHVVVTNTLETTTLQLTKTWEEDGAETGKVRPKQVTFALQYKHTDTGGTDGDGWQNLNPIPDWIPVEEGQGFKVEKADNKIVLTTEGAELPNNLTVTLTGLPKKDTGNSSYSYRVSETTIAYATTSGETITYASVAAASGAFDSTDKQTWTATLGTYDNTTTTVKDGEVWKTTSVNTRDYVNFKAVKNWQDAANRDGKRPNATFQLYRDEQPFGAPQELSESGYVVWSKLPKWKNDASNQTDGNQSVYVVREVMSGTYHAEYTSDRSDNVLNTQTASFDSNDDKTLVDRVTNTYTAESFSITASKHWSDSNNKYNIRPDNIYLTLTAQTKTGDGEYQTVTVGHKDNDDTSTYLQPGAQDGSNVYTTSAVTQQLTADSGNTTEVWTQSVTWNNLPVYANGHKIKYNVIETDSAGTPVTITNYTFTSSPTDVEGEKNSSKSIIATNTHSHLATAVVEKKWTLGGDEETTDDTIAQLAGNYLPISVEVQLQSCKNDTNSWQNVVESGVDSTKVLKKAGNWREEWRDLPKYYDDGGTEKEIKYRVVEKKLSYVNGETTVEYNVSNNRIGPFVYNTVGENGYELKEGSYHSTLKNDLPVVDISLTKNWVDDVDKYDTRPDGLPITVVGKSSSSSSSYDLSFYSDSPEWVIRNSSDEKTGTWTVTVGNLPKYKPDGTLAAYQISESTVLGYTETKSSDDVTVTEEGTGLTASLTNTLETVSLKLVKEWDDFGNAYGTRPIKSNSAQGLYVTVEDQNSRIYAIDISGEEEKYPITVTWQDKSDNSLIADNQWETVITGLPKYLPKTNTEAVYTVWETVPDNYDENGTGANISASTSGLSSQNGVYQLSHLKNPVKTTSINVEKAFEGTIPDDLKPSSIQYTVEWWNKNKVGADKWDPYIGSPITDGYITVTAVGADNEANTADDWKVSVTGFPEKDAAFEPILYRVKESKLIFNATSYSEPQSGTETWTGDENDAKKKTTWSAKVLPYDAVVTTTQGNDGTFTATSMNTLITVTAVGVKKWKDNRNRDGQRPKYVEFTLKRDGTTYGETKLLTGDPTSDLNWTCEWDGLPMYRKDSSTGNIVLCSYEVIETGYQQYPESELKHEAIPEYDIETSTEAGSITDSKTFTIVNKYNRNSKKFTIRAAKAWHEVLSGLTPNKVTLKLEAMVKESPEAEYKSAEVKTWTDLSNLDYLNPDHMEPHEVVYTTSAVTQKIELTSGEDWKAKIWTWDNLPVSAHGFPIKYYVVETEPLGYSFILLSSAPAGYTIANGTYGEIATSMPIEGQNEGDPKYVVLENQPGVELPSTGNRFGSRNDVYMISFILLAGAAFVYLLKCWARKREMEEELAFVKDFWEDE